MNMIVMDYLLNCHTCWVLGPLLLLFQVMCYYKHVYSKPFLLFGISFGRFSYPFLNSHLSHHKNRQIPFLPGPPASPDCLHSSCTATSTGTCPPSGPRSTNLSADQHRNTLRQSMIDQFLCRAAHYICFHPKAFVTPCGCQSQRKGKGKDSRH